MMLAGSSVVFSKILATSGIPTFLANALILLPAALALLALAWRWEGNLRVPLEAWRPLLIQASCGIVLFRVFLFYGLPLTSAASAGILTSTAPALSALLAWFVLRERLGKRSVFGVLLTAVGVGVLTVPGSSSGAGTQPVLGNALVLGAVIGEALWNVVSKTSVRHLSPLKASSLTTLLALAMFAPLAVPQAVTFDFAQVSLEDWLAILYYALGATVLAYVAWFAGVRHVHASTAAVFTGWLPVSAVALSALVLREPLTAWHALGLACVLCATLIFARPEESPLARDEQEL
jgi:drug/metabolite transporter (DMT)-like permease